MVKFSLVKIGSYFTAMQKESVTSNAAMIGLLAKKIAVIPKIYFR